MFQDIEPKVLHNEYVNKKPDKDDFVLFSTGEKILIKLVDEKLTVPTIAECEGFGEFRYLLAVDDRGYYGIEPKDADEFVRLMGEKSFNLEDKFIVRGKTPEDVAFALATCFHITSFYEKNKFCGKCGTRYKHSDKERSLICPSCGQTLYPRLNPAMIVAITDGDRILLSRYAGGYYKRYALIAGYSEIGETIEGTVHREVMEETGLKVKNIRYFASQPWAFTQSLLIGFFAELDGSDKVVVSDELSEAVWFKREDIPRDDSTLSMTKTMIEYFRTHPEEF